MCGRKAEHPGAGPNPALLPLRAKKPRAWTNAYVRHGTQTLLAALEIATGKVIAHVRDRRTTVDFLSFMDEVVKSYPLDELHVVLDNLNIHKNEAAKQWLLRHPRVHFHYTPTHASWMNASWMNMIECFFSILTKQALTQSVQSSQKDLKDFPSAWMPGFSSTHKTNAFSSGFRYNPDDIQQLGFEIGVGLKVKVHIRCSCNLAATRMG